MDLNICPPSPDAGEVHEAPPLTLMNTEDAPPTAITRPSADMVTEFALPDTVYASAQDDPVLIEMYMRPSWLTTASLEQSAEQARP